MDNCDNSTVFGHLEMKGAVIYDEANNRSYQFGTNSKELEERNIKVIAGHNHMAQGTNDSSYQYLGSLFYNSFNDSPRTYYGEYTKEKGLIRKAIQDWKFITIDTKNITDFSPKLAETKSDPCAIKVRFHVNKNRAEYFRNAVLGYLNRLGYTNIQYLKVEMVLENRFLEKQHVDTEQDIPNALVEFAKAQKFTDSQIEMGIKIMDEN
jgi:hypothetical protein